MLNICHGFIHVKAFFFFFPAAKTTENCDAETWRRCAQQTPLFNCCHSVWITLKFARLRLRKEKKRTCTIICFCFIYSDALHSLDNITFYLLQTLNGHGYRCLGNEKKMQSSFCFQPFLFYYFMFDKLENNFLLYMIISISIHIYIYTNIYIYNVNV